MERLAQIYCLHAEYPHSCQTCLVKAIPPQDAHMAAITMGQRTKWTCQLLQNLTGGILKCFRKDRDNIREAMKENVSLLIIHFNRKGPYQGAARFKMHK